MKIGVSDFFSEKEIKEMPILKDCKFRLKANGSTEIRYRRGGISKSFCGKTPQIAKKKAREWLRAFNEKIRLNQAATKEEQSRQDIFENYVRQWIEIEKKPYVKKITLETYLSECENHLFPRFGERKLQSIRYPELQEFLNEFLQAGKYRLADKIRNYLQQIFQSALDDELIEKSPAKRLKKIVYQKKNGVPLTRAEEAEFVRRVLADQRCRCRYALLLILYSGIRRNELHHVQIDAERKWITIENGKTRKGAPSVRSIPISPILARYIDRAMEELDTPNDYLSRQVPIFTDGKHHLHDLRHTFITRAQECGIPQEVVSRWVGHSRGNSMTDQVYTHLSKEYQEEEIKKFDY